MRNRSPAIIQRARELRAHMTPQECRLWNVLRNRGIAGLKFRRQKPIDGYIADFCCLENGIVVEVDGSVHHSKNGIIYDAERDSYFEAKGYHVLRFRNEEIETNLESVIEKIKRAASRPLARLREREVEAEIFPAGEG